MTCLVSVEFNIIFLKAAGQLVVKLVFYYCRTLN